MYTYSILVLRSQTHHSLLYGEVWPWILEQDMDWKHGHVKCYFFYGCLCTFLAYLYLLAQV